MTTTANFHVSNLIDKMSSVDKDFRFMAANDLLFELNKDAFKLDDEMEKKIAKMVLKLLEDKNGEVQNLGIKCLVPLIMKVKNAQGEFILETLCYNMLSENEELRDISSIGLKSTLRTFTNQSLSHYNSSFQKLLPHLLKNLQKETDASIQLEVLDIVNELINLLTTNIQHQQNLVEEALIPLLSVPRMAIRKRSIVALSSLMQWCTHPMYDSIIQELHNRLGQAGKTRNISLLYTYIQCLGAFSRSTGSKLTNYLPMFMPYLLQLCESHSLNHLSTAEVYHDALSKVPVNQVDSIFPPNANTEELDELIDTTLQTLDSLIKSSGLIITPATNGLTIKAPLNNIQNPNPTSPLYPYLPQIIHIALIYLSYDPNYNYGDQDDDQSNEKQNFSSNGDKTAIANGTDIEYMDEGDDNDGDQFSPPYEESDLSENDDEDDLSWKVRRSACKCLKSLLETNGLISDMDLNNQFYRILAKSIMSRFKEREENVKLDVINLFSCLLARVYSMLQLPLSAVERENHLLFKECTHLNNNNNFKEALKRMEINVCNYEDICNILNQAHKLLYKKNFKIPQATYHLISKLTDIIEIIFKYYNANILRNDTAFRDKMNAIIKATLYTIRNSQCPSGVRIEAIQFLHKLALFEMHLKQMDYKILHMFRRIEFQQFISDCLNEKSPKFLADFFALLKDLINSLSLYQDVEIGRDIPLYLSWVHQCYNRSSDTEVKEKAIAFMVTVLHYYSPKIKPDMIELVLKALRDRIVNESTRISALRSLIFYLKSHNTKIVFPGLDLELLQILAQYLQKNDATLKTLSLTAMSHILKNHQPIHSKTNIEENKPLATFIGDSLVNNQLPRLLLDSDTRILQLTIYLLTVILDRYPSTISQAWKFFEHNDYSKSSNMQHKANLNIFSGLHHIIYSIPLQGDILKWILVFFQNFAMKFESPMFEDIVKYLTQPLDTTNFDGKKSFSPIPSFVFQNMAKITVAMIANHHDSKCLPFLHQCLSNFSQLTPLLIQHYHHAENNDYSDKIDQLLYTLYSLGELMAQRICTLNNVIQVFHNKENSKTNLLQQDPMSVFREHIQKRLAELCIATLSSNNIAAKNNGETQSSNNMNVDGPKTNSGKQNPLNVYTNSKNGDLRNAIAFTMGSFITDDSIDIIPTLTEEMSSMQTNQAIYQLFYLSAFNEYLINYDPIQNQPLTDNKNTRLELILDALLNLYFSVSEVQNISTEPVFTSSENISSDYSRLFCAKLCSCLSLLCYLIPNPTISQITAKIHKLSMQLTPTNSEVKTNNTNYKLNILIQSIIQSLTHETNQEKSFAVCFHKNGDAVGLDEDMERSENGHKFSNFLQHQNEYNQELRRCLPLITSYFMNSSKDTNNNDGKNCTANSSANRCFSVEVLKLVLNLINHCIYNKSTFFYEQNHQKSVNTNANSDLMIDEPNLLLTTNVLSFVFEQTSIKKELIREVEMGPFKHSVDDGLELRKAAYECLFAWIENPNLFVLVDPTSFIDYLVQAINDHYDIKMLTYIALSSRLHPLYTSNVLVKCLDRLLNPIKMVLSATVKQNAVKQEFEKQDDLKRCALRTAFKLLHLPGADQYPYIQDFLKWINAKSDLSLIKEGILKEHNINL